MNTIRRITALLLATMLLLTLLPMGLTATADTTDGYGRSILAQMDNAAALLYMYDVIAEAAYGTPATISLNNTAYRVTWEEACTVYELVLSDHPDIFWHGENFNGSAQGDYAIALHPTYTLTGAALDEARAALEDEVVRLTADLAGKSDYEKSILLHDRLAAETVYALQGDHQTAYGALVQGTAVCAGYARAYQLLMQRAGIPTWYVTGSSYSPAGQLIAHAWNLVQLDGAWYYTDVTWDDQTNYTFYAYLNNTTAQMAESHFVDAYAEYLPAATATTHNYHVRHDLVMEQFDVNKVADVIRNHYPPRIYVTGDKNAFVQDYATYLLDLCDALNAPAGSIRYGYASLGHEIILNLIIEHTCQYATHTVAPTCTTDGYTVEICSYEFCHNEQNRVTLPANGEHTYDHGCDAECNTCGATREVEEHDYTVTHLLIATCGRDGHQVETCRRCDATRTTVLPATGNHIYANACDPDCNFCGATRQVEGHIYDNPCDPDCNTCGTVRTVDHVYDSEEDTECNVCGAARPTHTPGDVNGDGKVNVRDLGALQQFVNGWDVTIIRAAADVNGDGKINVRDLGTLQQFVNGWDVTLK